MYKSSKTSKLLKILAIKTLIYSAIFVVNTRFRAIVNSFLKIFVKFIKNVLVSVLWIKMRNTFHMLSRLDINRDSKTLKFTKPILCGTSISYVDVATVTRCIKRSYLIASIPSILSPVGCIASIFIIKHGRRKNIIIGGIIDILGWILTASSYSVTQLLIARVLSGFAHGLLAVPAHIYIVEITSIHASRVLNVSTSVFISLGCLLSYLYGYMFEEWRFMATGILSVELLSVLAVSLFLPESPYWLLIKGRENDARKSLLRLRGLKKPTPSFETEFAEIISHIQPQISRQNNQEIKKTKSSYISNIKNLIEIFKKPEVWKPFMILNIFFFLHNFSGLSILTSYTVDVVSNSGVTIDPFMATFIIGIAQTISGIILMACSFRLGRRHTAIFCSVTTSISYIALGIYKQFFEYTHLSIIPLTCLLILAIVGTVGFGSLPWTMLGELYPTKYVHILGPLTICLNSLTTFIVLQFYPLTAEYSFIMIIWFLCGSTIISTLYFALFLPETAGVSKINIEKQFRKES